MGRVMSPRNAKSNMFQLQVIRLQIKEKALLVSESVNIVMFKSK